MENNGKNLLVLFNNKFNNKQEENCLKQILHLTGSSQQFCTAHELVDRNRITSKKKKIVKESGRISLRAFRFLINKN